MKMLYITAAIVHTVLNLQLVYSQNNNIDNKTKDVKNIISLLPHSLPIKYRTYILKNPQEFLQDAKAVITNSPAEVLVLVDKQHSIGKYVPSHLIDLDTYKNTLSLNKAHLQLDRSCIADLLQMTQDASEQNIKLPISSAYRSYDYQKKLFTNNVAQIGQVAAERESARAGTSQHQLGLAIDFGSITDSFENTAAGIWLFNNAWKHGYSLSYPKNQEHITGYRYESWHYRYIGKPAAAFERKYFTKGQQYTLEILQTIKTTNP